MKRAFLMRGLFLFAVTGVMCGFLGNAAEVAAAEANPIIIGVSQDFSGVTAQEGLQEFPAFEMAVKEKNAAGGVLGRPVKLFTLDNGGDPTKTVGTLKVLKELNKCPVIYYGINSVGGTAAKAWADQNHIPVIAAAPISDKMWQEEGKAWFFRTQTTNTEGAKAFLLQAKKMGYKKIGLHVTTQAFGTDLEAVIKKHIGEYGLEFVGSVRCEPESKDLTIQATRLKALGPEVVIHQNYPADQIVFARALKTIGWKPVSFGGALIVKICLDLSPPELYEGWVLSTLFDRDKPGVKTFWDKYEAYTKKRIESDLTARGWDTAQILMEIIRLSGNPDNPEAIRDAFYKIKNFPMLTGHRDTVCNFVIGRNHVFTGKDYVFSVVKAGKVVPLADK